MFNLCNITAGQASDYYEKDNYYLRSGGGEWTGSLKDHFKLPDRIAADDFNRLIAQHEKFRTFDLKFYVSNELNHLAENEAFRRVHDRVVAGVLRRIDADLRERHGFGITFKPEIKYKVNREGSLTVSVTSYNVAVKKCEQAADILFAAQYRDLYRERVTAALKGIDIVAEASQFNLQAFENSGRVGFDLTFSPPKSVSIAMTVNDSFNRALKEAHDLAIKDTLHYVQQHFVEYRFGKEAQRRKSNEVLIAKIDHFVSRRLDPQLHSHCILFNTCRGEDGTLRSIANEQLYDHQRHIGLDIYNTQMAHYARQKGFEIEVDEYGKWELKGISREQILPFSKGRAEVEEYVDARGLDIHNASDRERANLSTRRPKGNADFDLLEKEWAGRRQEWAIDEKTFVRQRDVELKPGRAESLLNRMDQKIPGVTDTFNRFEYIAFASKEAVAVGMGVDDILAHFEQGLRNRQFVPVLTLEHGETRFMTRESYELENRIFERIRQGLGRATFNIDKERYVEYLSGSSLTPDQQNAVEFILGSPDRFSALNGKAGAGKTHLFKEVDRIFSKEGYTLRGLCFTGKAAYNLEVEAGIRSRTLHSFFNSLEREAGNKTPVPGGEIQNDWNFDGLQKAPAGEIWIVDEANMINNKLMDYLQRAALYREASVVFTGDFRQLQPIGGGHAYSRLILEQRILYYDLNESFRQRHAPAHIRQAVDEAAGGRLERSLTLLKNNTFQIEAPEERFSRMARDFASLRDKDLYHSVIITGTNRDRIRLNEWVRGELKTRGVLADGVKFQLKNQKDMPMERELSINDRIMFLRNDRQVGVLNGQIGVIKDISHHMLKVETQKGTTFIDADQYRYLDHYYASTTWKAEGDSYQKVFINIDTGQSLINNRQDYYVKISRTREHLTIYTNDRPGLLDAVSKSAFHILSTREQTLRNKLSLLPPNIGRDLYKGADSFLKYRHFKALSDRYFESMRDVFGRDDQLTADYSRQYRKYTALGDRHLDRARQLYEGAAGDYGRHLDRQYHSPCLRAEILDKFKRDFMPEAIADRIDEGFSHRSLEGESPGFSPFQHPDLGSENGSPLFYNPDLPEERTLDRSDLTPPDISLDSPDPAGP